MKGSINEVATSYVLRRIGPSSSVASQVQLLNKRVSWVSGLEAGYKFVGVVRTRAPSLRENFHGSFELGSAKILDRTGRFPESLSTQGPYE